MDKFFVTFIIFIMLVACTGDPPLLSTPLPNGHAFDSNGGWFGYLKTPDGKRMADHFGILDNGSEAWCEEFAWRKDIAICKLYVTRTINGKEQKETGFFIIDTSTGDITKFKTEEKANTFWKEIFGNPLPPMKTKYRTTKRK